MYKAWATREKEGMDARVEALAKELGARVRRLRGTTTQAKVAEAVGIEPDTLGRIERGKRLPSLTVLVKLADRLQVSPASLLADDESWARAAKLEPHQRRIVDAASGVPPEFEEAAVRMLAGLGV